MEMNNKLADIVKRYGGINHRDYQTALVNLIERYRICIGSIPINISIIGAIAAFDPEAKALISKIVFDWRIDNISWHSRDGNVYSTDHSDFLYGLDIEE